MINKQGMLLFAFVISAHYWQSNSICCSIKEHQHCEGNFDHKQSKILLAHVKTSVRRDNRLYLDGSIVQCKNMQQYPVCWSPTATERSVTTSSWARLSSSPQCGTGCAAAPWLSPLRHCGATTGTAQPRWCSLLAAGGAPPCRSPPLSGEAPLGSDQVRPSVGHHHSDNLRAAMRRVKQCWISIISETLNSFHLTWRTGHNFHKVVRRLPPLELLHQILDVAETICGCETQQDNSVFLQSHFLKVFVPVAEGSMSTPRQYSISFKWCCTDKKKERIPA